VSQFFFLRFSASSLLLLRFFLFFFFFLRALLLPRRSFPSPSQREALLQLSKGAKKERKREVKGQLTKV